ncbi:hypothetical protein LCGC14_1390250 [marine sediment metagenome]|uniref:Uncharacterized protein n=1 Tax=marine sediment metagenome TaxID=412755 RepID=A0A0F9N1R7_9ZZZZ
MVRIPPPGTPSRPPAPDHSRGGSLIEYERIKTFLPEFILNNLPPEPNLSVVCQQKSYNYKIPIWEYNKIREILKTIYHGHGMRVRFNRYDTFLWGMALSVNDNKIIDSYATRYLWNSQPIKHKWRDFWTVAIPNERVADLLHALPSQIDDSIIASMMAAQTWERWGVFRWFTYKNTMATELIICNWDIILEVLNRNGY